MQVDALGFLLGHTDCYPKLRELAYWDVRHPKAASDATTMQGIVDAPLLFSFGRGKARRNAKPI